MTDLHRVAVALSLILGCLATGAARAQTWSGLGADNNWSTGANWAGSAPASSGTTVVDFVPSPRTSPVVDVPWTVNRLNTPTPTSFTFSGQALTFAGATPSIVGSTNMTNFTNPIVLAGPLLVTTSVSVRFNGPMSGTGSLTVAAGTGIVSITGNETYSGGTTVMTGGFVIFTGSMLGPVNVNSLGILNATGTISGAVVVNAGGFLGPALALNTGDLTLAGGTGIDIAGPALGTQYSNVNVTGTVNLSGSTLTLSGAYVPQRGDVFTIITNDGVDAVTGTFTGLPEGSTITFNGVPLRVSYVGGTGNDVTLSAPPAPIAPVPTLSQWGLVALATLVLGIGFLCSRPR